MSKITTTKFKSSVEWLSKPSHAITVAVLLVLVVALVWFAVKKLKVAIHKWNSAPEPTVDQSNLTPGLNFSELASRLWDATVGYHSLGMASWFIFNMPTGTNETEVYAVLNTLRTTDDYLELKKQWKYLYAEKSAISSWITQANSTLPGTLVDELNAKELSRCRNILESHGITPDF